MRNPLLFSVLSMRFGAPPRKELARTSPVHFFRGTSTLSETRMDGTMAIRLSLTMLGILCKVRCLDIYGRTMIAHTAKFNSVRIVDIGKASCVPLLFLTYIAFCLRLGP